MSSIDLHFGARKNAVQEIKNAIAEGMDVNARDVGGSTPLDCAIAGKAIEAALLLLENGADVRVQDNDGSTALHSAIEHRLPIVVEELLKRDPSLIKIADKYGNEPLWTAAFDARLTEDYSVVSLLLYYGADPNHRNNVNLSPIDMAKRTGDQTLLRVLQSAGAR